jgi:hypothetical protein
VLWLAISTVAVIAARKAAARAYRIATGEDPPKRT